MVRDMSLLSDQEIAFREKLSHWSSFIAMCVDHKPSLFATNNYFHVFIDDSSLSKIKL